MDSQVSGAEGAPFPNRTDRSFQDLSDKPVFWSLKPRERVRDIERGSKLACPPPVLELASRMEDKVVASNVQRDLLAFNFRVTRIARNVTATREKSSEGAQTCIPFNTCGPVKTVCRPRPSLFFSDSPTNAVVPTVWHARDFEPLNGQLRETPPNLL